MPELTPTVTGLTWNVNYEEQLYPVPLYPVPAESREYVARRISDHFYYHTQLAWANLQEVIMEPPDGGKSILDYLADYGLKHAQVSEPTDTVPDTNQPLHMVTITRDEPLAVNNITYGEHFTDGHGYEHWGRLLEVKVPVGENDFVANANAHALYIRPATLRTRRHRWRALREVLGEPERRQRHVLNGDLNTPALGFELRRTCAALGRHAITGNLRDATWEWYRGRWVRLNLDHMLMTMDLMPIKEAEGPRTVPYLRHPSDHTALRASFLLLPTG